MIPLTSLTSQKAETGKAWNETNLQSTSLYGCIHLVLLFFHQADYGNITVIRLTMCYFSWGVSFDHVTTVILRLYALPCAISLEVCPLIIVQISRCLITVHYIFFPLFTIKFEHTYNYIMQYIERELNKLRVYSMVGILWDNMPQFNQQKEIIIVN